MCSSDLFVGRTDDESAQAEALRLLRVPTGVGYESMLGTLSPRPRHDDRPDDTPRQFVFADGHGGVEKIRIDVEAPHLAHLAEALDTNPDAARVSVAGPPSSAVGLGGGGCPGESRPVAAGGGSAALGGGDTPALRAGDSRALPDGRRAAEAEPLDVHPTGARQSPPPAEYGQELDLLDDLDDFGDFGDFGEPAGSRTPADPRGRAGTNGQADSTGHTDDNGRREPRGPRERAEFVELSEFEGAEGPARVPGERRR